MNCLIVRERLPEHALGVLPRADASTVDRHLEWCAACRKEAGELQRAAATLAFTVAPAEPPAELEGWVVLAVREAAGRRRAAAPRRSRVAAAGVLAAMLALSGLGWGAVMAGRSERLQQQVEAAEERRERSVRNFREVLAELEGTDPANILELASLLSPRQRPGSGDALVLLSPSSNDIALVVLTGLAPSVERHLPLEVRLVSEESGELIVGRIPELDTGRGGWVWEEFVQDLSSFDAVVVRDARGRVLLNGSLTVDTPVG